MPLLVELFFAHHSVHSTERGFKEFLITDSDEQALTYIDKEYLGISLPMIGW